MSARVAYAAEQLAETRLLLQATLEFLQTRQHRAIDGHCQPPGSQHRGRTTLRLLASGPPKGFRSNATRSPERPAIYRARPSTSSMTGIVKIRRRNTTPSVKVVAGEIAVTLIFAARLPCEGPPVGSDSSRSWVVIRK